MQFRPFQRISDTSHRNLLKSVKPNLLLFVAFWAPSQVGVSFKKSVLDGKETNNLFVRHEEKILITAGCNWYKNPIVCYFHSNWFCFRFFVFSTAERMSRTFADLMDVTISRTPCAVWSVCLCWSLPSSLSSSCLPACGLVTTNLGPELLSSNTYMSVNCLVICGRDRLNNVILTVWAC